MQVVLASLTLMDLVIITLTGLILLQEWIITFIMMHLQLVEEVMEITEVQM